MVYSHVLGFWGLGIQDSCPVRPTLGQKDGDPAFRIRLIIGSSRRLGIVIRQSAASNVKITMVWGLGFGVWGFGFRV